MMALALLWVTAALLAVCAAAAMLSPAPGDEEPAPPRVPLVAPFPAPSTDEAERIRRRGDGPVTGLPRQRIPMDIAAHFARRERGEL